MFSVSYATYLIHNTLLLNNIFNFCRMAEDLDVEAMLEAPYNKSVSICYFFMC